MKTVQDLAQSIASIDWPGVQSDIPEANLQLNTARQILMRMDKADAVNLLLEVLEVKVLNAIYPHSIFSDMMRFERMYHSYPSFVPVGESGRTDEQINSWFDLLVKINSMAQYKDNRHFGLPMSQAENIIHVCKQDFELKKIAG